MRKLADPRDPRARSRGPRFLLLILAVALLAVAALPAVLAQGAEGELEGPAAAPPACAAAPGGTSQSFSHRGAPYPFRVPPGVTKLSIDAQGGHGGQFDHTAVGGRGARVTGWVTVTPGECLTVYVGEFGYGHGGDGWAHGGEHGEAGYGSEDTGHDGAGGGGASALTKGSEWLVVAGGGGGGGGDAGNDSHRYGGPGGDAGAEGSSANFNRGEEGAEGDPHEHGGCAGCEHGTHGGAGHNTEETNEPESGAGGGGGGGLQGGAGGEDGYSGPVVDASNGGGGGGGAGSSGGVEKTGSGGIAESEWHFATSPRSCEGSKSATCDGVVTLSWQLAPAKIATEGSGQAATVGTEFARPLSAIVTDAAGTPLSGIAVTFTLPSGGATATFAGGGRSASATTNAKGVVTSPVLTASPASGEWSADAKVAAIDLPAVYTLRNDPGRTATTLTSSVEPSYTGEPVTFTARVGGAAGPLRPTGTVEFKLDGAVLATGTLGPDGVATAPAQRFDAGVHQVEAEYLGDESFAGSAGGPFTQRVEKGATGMTLTSSSNPSETGASATFTAALAVKAPAEGVATGTVQFAVDGTPLGGPVALAPDGTAVSPATGGLALGQHVVTADYSGDAQFTPATARFTQSVGPDATAAEVIPSVTPAFFGEPVRLTGVVRTALRAPTGQLEFRVDGAFACDVPLREPTPPAVDASAECALPEGLAPGEHALEVVYAGAAGFEPTSGSATLAVIPSRTSLTLTATPREPTYGGELTLRANVAALLPSQATPTGAVLFSVDGDVAGPPVALDGEGLAALTLAEPLGAGPHEIAAEYLGATGFLNSSDGAPLAVAPARTTTTLSSTADPAAPGSAVSFDAKVAVEAPGGGEPGGTVQFLVDGLPLGLPVAVAGGEAHSAAVSDLDPGVSAVTARYSGDERYSPSHAEREQRVEEPPAAKPAPGPAAPPSSVALTAPPRGELLDKQVRVKRGGAAPLRVRCVSASGSPCADQLTLRARSGDQAAGIVAGARLGDLHYRLGAGAVRTVTVKLSAAGRRALVADGRLVARALVAPVDGSRGRTQALTLIASRSPALVVDNTRVPVFASGRVRVQAYCEAPATVRCVGRVTITAADGRPLASRGVVLRGDRHGAVALISPALRRLAGAGESVEGEIAAASSSPAAPETRRAHGVLLLPVGYRGGSRAGS